MHTEPINPIRDAVRADIVAACGPLLDLIESLTERVAQLEAHVDAIHKVVVLIPVPQYP